MTRTASRGVRSSGTTGRRARRWVVTVAVIVVLLVVLDFGARIVAQDALAARIEKQQGLSARPAVTIDGFPFLTQAASRDFGEVHITATGLTEGPVTVTRVTATARGVQINSFSFSGGTIASLSGTALISFHALADALTRQVGPLGAVLAGAGLSLAKAGPDQVKATLNLVVATGSATWRITRLSGTTIRARLVDSSNVPASLLNSIQEITLRLPKLPLGLRIDSVYVTPGGITGRVSGRDVSFGS